MNKTTQKLGVGEI